MKTIVVCFLSLIMSFGAAKAQTADQKNAALETLGTASGFLSYQIFIGIGAIADGYVKEAYNAETVNTLMAEQMNSCKSINEQYQKLINSGFLTDPEDVAYVKEFMAVITLLSNEANALKTFVNNETEANNAAYQMCREQAWSALSELLGIE